MKLVVGIVRPEALEVVKEALAEVEVFRLTVSDVQGMDPSGFESPESDAAGLRPWVKLEIAVNETFCERTVTTIVRSARTAGTENGHGWVYVLPLSDAIRIRTGERGPEAI